jgi:fructuronate reductase
MIAAPRPVGTRATAAGIVHLGAGGFARAHPWLCTAEAVDGEPGPWGVVAVANRSATVVNALRENGWRYEVELRDDEGTRTHRVALVRDGLVAAAEPDRVREWLADPAIRVVLVTATEAGYPARPGTRRLDGDRPDVVADLAGTDRRAPPRTVPARLAAAAADRARRGAPPLTVVACDNVHDAGHLLRGLTGEFARRHGDDAVAAVLDHWAFPNTVVDRIVPAVPAHRQPNVVAEPWFRWVIEDRFAGPRPRWGDAGARVVTDPSPWRDAKLLLVNAPHSMLAYAGLLLGRVTVSEALRHRELRAAVERALDEELVPCVPPAAGLDPAADAARTLHRFANGTIAHPLRQVGADGSHKLPQRFGAVARRCREGTGGARWAALTIACWAHAVRQGLVHEPRAADVVAALGHGRPAAVVLDVAGLAPPDDRRDRADPVAAEVGRRLAAIDSHGVAAALKQEGAWT